MKESFCLGAYWGPRQESAEGCVHRLEACLHGLSTIHPLLVNSFVPGNDPMTALLQGLDELSAFAR